MCGIVGYNGKEKAIEKIVTGLEALEYRGYDSAGIAYFEKDILPKKDAQVGIGHTRWATHGEPSERNAHPHRCGKFTLVHNGIIENYLELKNILQENGYSFLSETDTEVAVALLDYLYEEEKGVWNSF